MFQAVRKNLKYVCRIIRAITSPQRVNLREYTQAQLNNGRNVRSEVYRQNLQ